MDYAEQFLRIHEKKESIIKNKISFLEAMKLNYDLVNKMYEGGFKSSYTPRLDKIYYPEEQILNWMDKIVETPGCKFFRWYFKQELHGVDKIPEKEGAMIVSNHTTLFFADIAPLYFGLYEQKRRVLYALAHKILRDSDFFKSVGAIYGTKQNGIQLLQDDKLALVCPGGILDACKPWYYNYKVRPIEGFAKEALGYLKVAHAANKPIIPVGSVGGEETVFIAGDAKEFISTTLRSLDDIFKFSTTKKGKFMFQLLKEAKLVPIVLTPPLPSKVDVYVGDSIDIRGYLGNNPTQEDYWALNVKVMADIQSLVNKGLKERGKDSLVEKVKSFFS